MSACIGDEPNSSGRDEANGSRKEKRAPKVPSDLISVLPMWKDYSAVGRVEFKGKSLRMFKQRNGMYLLKNDQHAVQ